jgi:hypothetical protein
VVLVDSTRGALAALSSPRWRLRPHAKACFDALRTAGQGRAAYWSTGEAVTWWRAAGDPAMATTEAPGAGALAFETRVCKALENLALMRWIWD